jgi:DinB superfamily
MDGIDWNEQLVGQLDWYWRQHFRPRLHSLTDDEYFWKPVQGCWNVHPRGASAAPVQAGGGVFTIDFAFPEPDPPPVTTIAWRVGHILSVYSAFVPATISATVDHLPEFRLRGHGRRSVTSARHRLHRME